ncbi:WD40 repeat-like protein [Fistulina hepatica ATCC 64428]|nr:WD40 repeat-like protein [Fistulina hepatica ATCC 64428]
MSTDKFMVAEAQLAINENRWKKSKQTKALGSPIKLTGIALDIKISDGQAWIAENTTVVKQIDLETGKTVKSYRGHIAPVTCLEFYSPKPGTLILLTGSWDKTIKLWDTKTPRVVSSTDAHSDFVKILFVEPELRLLISGSSDKVVRFWGLAFGTERHPLTNAGSITAHTRPVEAVHAHHTSDSSAILITGDTMGAIKVWNIVKDDGVPPRWKCTLLNELSHHRTRINELCFGAGCLWTASADETVQMLPHPETFNIAIQTPSVTIKHPTAVRALLPLSLSPLAEPYVLTAAGDVIRAYDVSTPTEPELLGEVDAHWHDVLALRFWPRKYVGDDGITRLEPWIVSTSLDGTLRKWKLAGIVITPAAQSCCAEAADPSPDV